MQITDEQRMIRDEVARFLDAEGGLGPARAAADGDAGAGAALWARFAGELGMAAAALPEAVGGLGLGMVELALISREIGARLAPVPHLATAGLSAGILLEAGEGERRDAWLARIAAGDCVVATVLGAEGLAATPDGADFRLDGVVGGVEAAAGADLLLVPTRVGDQLRILAVEPGAGVSATPEETLDATRPAARVGFEGARAHGIGGPGAEEGLARAMTRARLVEAAETVGAARGVFELTRAYVAERRQFGRTIASFQAVKHRLAALYVRLATAEALVEGLAAGIDAGLAPALAAAEARAALAVASELLDLAASEAIQLHGGVGFTWEYAPHLYFKRALTVRTRLGGAPAVFADLGRALAAGDLPASQPAEADGAFRREVAEWMAANLSDDFAPLRGRGGAGDGEAFAEERKAWERRLASGGWVGIGLPRDAGGRGLSVADQVIFNEEYARAGGPGRMGHIGEGLMAPTLVAWGTEEQRARHLPGILAGTTFWAQGYSEPGAGSDLAAVRTRARFDAERGEWRVSGQKIWTSLAHLSDWVFVLARAEEGSVGRQGLVFLLMPLDQPGIEIRPIRQLNGGAEFNEVFFDDARAGAEDLVGAVGDGWQVAMSLLAHERGISTLGQQLGFARELETIAGLAGAGGAPGPDIATALGRAWAGLRAMRYGALRTLGALERGAAGAEALTYKYEWSNWHRSLGELAMDVLGAEALVVSPVPEREALRQMALFARSETIYGGTNEVQLNIIAEHGLGMPREPRGKD